MLRHKLVLSLLTFALVLQVGCTTRFHNVGKGFTFEDDPGMAIVVVSTRLDSQCEGSIQSSFFIAEGITEKGRVRNMVIVSNALMDKDLEDPPGFLFIQDWPPGEYRLSHFSSSSTQGGGNSRDINIYFDIAPDSIQYLGEFYVEMPNCYSFTLEVRDDMESARKMFDERMDKLDSVSMVSKANELNSKLQATGFGKTR